MGLVRWSKELSSNPNVCGYFLQGILRMRLWWNYRLVKIDFSILIQLLQQFLDKEFSDSSIFGSAHPVSIIKSVIQRMLLFTWWSGFWFYEGTSVSLVSKSYRLSCARANMKFLVRENEHTGSDEKSKRKWAFLLNYPLFPVRALTSLFQNCLEFKKNIGVMS
jgi:hypothetical protein